MIIRVENARENLIRVHDVMQMLGFRCTAGSLEPMLNEIHETSKSADDIFTISKKYLGDTHQVKYVQCNFISKTYEVHDVLPSSYNNFRVDYETLMTALRVKRSREEYKEVLIRLLGTIIVPEDVEKYARQPRTMRTYYIIENGGLSTFRLFDWEADYISCRNYWGTELNVLTDDILEKYSKINDKRTNDYDNIPS